jgi:hypothetical protein
MLIPTDRDPRRTKAEAVILPLMPSGTMNWRLHVDAKTPEKAAKVALRVAALTDDRLAVQRIEPYWKLEGRQVVSCSLALRAESFAQAVVEALVVAGHVAGGWHVNAPEEAADGRRPALRSRTQRCRGVCVCLPALS